MDNNKEQYANAFHGIRKPGFIENDTTIIKKMFNGKESECMLKVMGNQQYQDSKCANIEDKTVGTGIYCTPHFQEALTYTERVDFQNNSYFVILQCRVRPKAIRIIKER